MVEIFLAELLNDRSRINSLKLTQKTCAECGGVFTEGQKQTEEIKVRNGKEVCADCFYKEHGEEE